MRALLLLLVAPTFAFASCEQEFREDFQTFQAEAVRQHPNLPTLSLQFGELPKELFGRMYYQKNLIKIDLKSCQVERLERQALIMHEIGHAITNIYYPTLGGKLHETMADQYGSKLWKRSEEFLAYLEEKCAEGYKWSCEKQVSWAYGMVH